MQDKQKPKEPRRIPEAKSMQYRKNKYAAPVSGVFLFLAVVGLIALTLFCINFTRGMLDNSEEKLKFEQIISPVLMFDPVPFEKAADADPLFLLQSSLWSTLLGEKRDSYQFDALGYLIVPSSDVDVTGARLFGADIALQHQTFGDIETTYVFDEPTKAYHVPVTGQTGRFTPSVEAVVKKGDLYTLTVGYMPPANAWTQGAGGATAQKYMLYELLKVKGNYRLMAIRDLPAEAATSIVAVASMPSSSAA